MAPVHRQPPQVDINAIRNAQAVEILKKGSLAIVGLYGIALCYRLGIVAKILPKSLNERLEKFVDNIKSKTEPPTGTKLFQVARKHLMKTYGYTTVGFVMGAVGIATFFRQPFIPIGVPFVLTLVPGLTLNFVPKKWLSDLSRIALFSVTCLAGGYTLGPMNWIAYDSLLPMGLFVGGTVVGFTAPLYLTRGMVSYFLSSQLLACSLAVSSTTLATDTAFDVNVMLVGQVCANIALGLFHTIPIIAKCVMWKESVEELESKELDPLLEAIRICGAVSYASWYFFRIISTAIFLRVTRDDKLAKGATREEQRNLRTFAHMTFNVDRWSNVCASILFVVAYVRVVSLLQKGNTFHQLEGLRKMFVRLSPLTALGGSPK